MAVVAAAGGRWKRRLSCYITCVVVVDVAAVIIIVVAYIVVVVIIIIAVAVKLDALNVVADALTRVVAGAKSGS